LRWALLGILILLADFLSVFYLSFVRGIDNSSIRPLFTQLLPFLAVLCFYRARRYDAREELDTRSGRAAIEDLRPPIVYLRSFKADDKAQVSHSRPQTQEELLASLFSEIGPFLAVGKPHEVLPTLGALRQYVDEDRWEKVVTELMSRARVIVLRVGETEGLLWEAHRAVGQVPPEKLMLLVPLGKRSYESFCRRAQSFFPRPLPDYPTWKFPPTSLQGVIIFGPDWEARFLPFKVALWRGSLADPSRSWRIALRPWYERLDLPWSLPPINWLRIALSAVCVGVLLFALAAYFSHLLK
jgi:hypothetical protein